MKYLFTLLVCCLVFFASFTAPAFAQQKALDVIISGNIKIVDDETIGEEVGYLTIDNEIQIDPGSTATLFDGNQCVGGEVRVEINIVADYSDPSQPLQITGKGELYEGTSCSTDELNATQPISTQLSPPGDATIVIDLLNTENNGGDTAKGDIRVIAF